MSKIHKKTGNTCPVCCEDIKDGIILHKTRRQTHKLCIDCCNSFLNPFIKQATKNLRQNIRHRISIIKCTGTYHGELRNHCKHELDFRYIELPKNSPLATDIFRISYVLSYPNVYLCPNENCGDVVETDPDSPDLKLTCQSCQKIWCRNCQLSPYHEGLSCMEYEAKQNNTSTGKLMWEKIQKGEIKFCPQCRSPVEKVKNNEGKFVGCNKIICTHCKSKWCWFCKEVGIDYDHFNPNSNTRCSNKLWENVAT